MADSGKNDPAQMFVQIMWLDAGPGPTGDAFDFKLTSEPTAAGGLDDLWTERREPTEPTATEAYPIKEGFFVFNRSDQGPDSGPGDGGIIIDWFPTETIRPMESLLI